MTLRRAFRLHTKTSTLYADWYIYADETQVDAANNRSLVSVSMAIFCSPGYSFTSNSINCGITGSSDRSHGYQTWSGETTIATGSFWVNHDANGEAAAHIYSWGNGGWSGVASFSDDFWLGLTTIPRASQPSISPSTISAGSKCTINTNRASSSFTHTIQYSFGSKSGTIATGVGSSCSWTPSTDLLSQIPNSQSGSGTITCLTYSGGTHIGTKTCGFTLTVPGGSNPSIGDISLTEQHAGVKAKNASITVQQISKKYVSVPISAKYYASIKSVSCDGVALSYSNGAYVGYVSNKSSGTYTVSVTDSRGLTTSKSVSQTFYAYAKPSVNGSIERESETSANGSLKANGSYSTVLNNTVTMTIKRNDESNASSVTPTLSNGSISFQKDYTDLEYTKAFSVTVAVQDSFGEAASVTVYLSVGRYAFALLKNGVVLGEDSYAFDKQNVMRSFLDFFHPVGTFYITENKDFNPGQVWGGTWELVKDRMLIGAGNSYAAKATGGSTTHKHTTGSHTLTVDEMPSHDHGIKGNTTGYNGGVAYNVYFGGGNPGTWDGYGGIVTARGGGKAHSHGDTGSASNLPPYYATYMWRRTA